MGHATLPVETESRPWQNMQGQHLTCLFLLLFLTCWIPFHPNLAHAVSLPYNESFTGDDGSALPTGWHVNNKTDDLQSYHEIHDNALRIFTGGNGDFNTYYATYLDSVSADFTLIVQIPYISDATAGLIFQKSLGQPENKAPHIRITVTPNSGLSMILDDNGDDTPEVDHFLAVDLSPPNIWLKAERKGTEFTAYYSPDGLAWTLLETVTTNRADGNIDAGLFCKSNGDIQADTHLTYFDNFALVGSTTTYLYFQDSDEDTFGNPSATLVTDSDTLPDGYVLDNTDCDDSDPDTYPGADEICDGKDNDCNGFVDEGHDTTTYYRDNDGDGYGSAADTHQGCSPNPGYVALPGDCNDNDNTINPGAIDICGNNLDEDCAGGKATCDDDTVCTPIADTPLSVTTGGSPGIIMFILDDSGSMEWSVMCAEVEGKFNGKTEYTKNYSFARWESQYHGYNRIYYNPNRTYAPWPNSASYTFSDASFTGALKHPLIDIDDPDFDCDELDDWGGDSLDLRTHFKKKNNTVITTDYTISFGHYYLLSDGQPWLVDLGTGTEAPAYYKVTLKTGGGNDPRKEVKNLSLKSGSDVPSDVVITGTLADARKNFANWFTYHRTRETSTKAALGMALQSLSGVKAGIYTLNNSVIREASLINNAADVKDFLDDVYEVDRDGGTPLDGALEAVGQYFDADDGKNGGIGPNPFDASEDGGDCQQAFAILMTDGYGNHDLSNQTLVGNDDADNNTDWDGDSKKPAEESEFYGHLGKRLPDVAMYYYERDLSTERANKVPVQDPDYEAPHQRMVTYTVSFGIEGNFSQAAYPNCPPSDPDIPINCPTWSNNNNNESRVDDLWHAAINGRGQYINTGTPEGLADAINSVLNDITRRIGTAASVAVNSEKLDTGLVIYQGFFDSGNWSGDLQAYRAPDGVVESDYAWSAKEQLSAMAWNARTILTKNDDSGTTIPFQYASLSTDQKADFTESQLKYIRGDDSNEKKNGGTFRSRSGKLGDVTHSSPILHNGVVYVGANDGMLHAFEADTGDELFAYVPTFVYPNLPQYTSPNYMHRFYVDGTPTAKAVSANTSWLVSGLRKGGRGLFGINISSPTTIDENNVNSFPAIWEYPAPGATDSDMGFTFGEVTIAPGNDPTAQGQLIFAANGYDSPNGHAVLMIFKMNGELFQRIDTDSGGTVAGTCNGLSTPLVVDLTDDGTADVVYAGDLLGNIWKFDVSSTSKGEWSVAYTSGNVKKPLFTAKNSSGDIQPITSKPAAMFHCDGHKKGTIVVFGTGRMLSEADLANTHVQTIYGIWDWQAELEDKGITTPGSYHLGAFNSPSNENLRTLSNLPIANSELPSGLTLLQQTEVSSDTQWRHTSNNPIEWFNVNDWKNSRETLPGYQGGLHLGWYMNLPEEKERVITKTQIRDGKAYVVSIIPEPAPCSAGGTTVGSILNACNGGQMDEPQWDTNNSGGVDSRDDNPSGKKFGDDIYYAPAIIEDKLFFTKDKVEDTTDETRGLFYWKIR